jgi:hypothetical protein
MASERPNVSRFPQKTWRSQVAGEGGVSPLCNLGWHRVSADVRWNSGYYFSRCERCGRDLVRTIYGRWHVPRGYRVVWQKAAPAHALPLGLDRRVPAKRRPSNLPIQHVLDQLRDVRPDTTAPLDQAPPALAPAMAAPATIEPAPAEPWAAEPVVHEPAKPVTQEPVTPQAVTPEAAPREPVPPEEVPSEPVSPDPEAQAGDMSSDPAAASPSAAAETMRSSDDISQDDPAGPTEVDAPEGLATPVPMDGGEDGGPPVPPEPLAAAPAQDHQEPPTEATPDTRSEATPPSSGPSAEDFMDDGEDKSAWDSLLSSPASRPVGKAPSANVIVWTDRAAGFGTMFRKKLRSRALAARNRLVRASRRARERLDKIDVPPATATLAGLAGGAAVSILAGVLAIAALLAEGNRDQQSSVADRTIDQRPGTRGFVTASLLNCRAAPVRQGRLVRRLGRGEEIEILANDANWASIDVQGRQCWVQARYVSAARPL